MITEDYVSFETAKLLHACGFWSDECVALYDCGNYNEFVREDAIFQNGAEDYLDAEYGEEWRRFGYYLAPTLQMAMKWLREKYHLEIYPFHDAIQECNTWWYRVERHIKGCGLTEHESDSIYGKYEDACEAAIKYCLENLI